VFFPEVTGWIRAGEVGLQNRDEDWPFANWKSFTSCSELPIFFSETRKNAGARAMDDYLAIVNSPSNAGPANPNVSSNRDSWPGIFTAFVGAVRIEADGC